MSSSSTAMRIAIAGGGPAGLTLAAILSKINIPYTLFELDASPSARSQGGTLDIHKNSGQLALEKAGILDVFKKHMRVDGTEMYLRDWTGKVYVHHTEEGEEDPERPEIDRRKLREILLDAVEGDRVKWGKKLVSADAEADGKFKLSFADGTSEEGYDLVVGADGTWSKIRPLRSDAVPPYSGVMCLGTSISSVKERYPDLAEFVGKGSSVIVNGKSFVMPQRNGDGSVKTYVMFEAPESWKETSGVDWARPQKEALTEFVEKYYPEWCKEVKKIVVECDEGELAFRPLYQYPPGHKLEKKLAGVTLIGDAAHVMTPLTGVGVNLAMHDAYDLALAIEKVVAGGKSLESALEEYETAVFERATENVKGTQRNQGLFFSGMAVEKVVELLIKAFSGQD